MNQLSGQWPSVPRASGLGAANRRFSAGWGWVLRFACLLAAFSMQAVHAETTVSIVNSDATGQVSRFDVDGHALDAHDGSILQVGELFYLYGTSYACGYGYQVNSQFCGFKVYSSPDLVHWTDRGYVVAPGNCSYCFRPHVIYNAATRKYVLWADAGGRYTVATSDSPTGIFELRPSPVLAVAGAVDMSLFVDDDGRGYLIHNTTLVDAGLTADMVVEPLTADYLNVTGESVRLGLGDVEAFTVFKRNGVYHALMSDPSCAYCSGSTGEMTALSMMGPWSGKWFDPAGVHQSGRAEPRWRSRIVNADNCGGQPLASFPVVDARGETRYYFMSDRWDKKSANESLANFFIGPMSFLADGTLGDIRCVNSSSLSLSGPAADYDASRHRDQNSGFDGFHHYCDVAGDVVRQQSFVPARSGMLSAASVTTFQRGSPTSPLTLEVVDAASGRTLSHSNFAVGSVPWAPTALTARPGVAVTAGRSYLLRLRTASSTGCYGFEYNDANPYAAGVESYSSNGGRAFVNEPARDLKFTTDVTDQPHLVLPGVPAGFTSCAWEGGTCSFAGTRLVLYGAGATEGAYRTKIANGATGCNVAEFGGDPVVGTLKSCYVAPAGGPSGYTLCATEGGTCSLPAPTLVAYGANGAYEYKILPAGATGCQNATFGADPLFGVAKACYAAPATGVPAGWLSCADEGGNCVSNSPRVVAYGARGAFYTLWVSGTIACGVPAMGGDPIFGVRKACYGP